MPTPVPYARVNGALVVTYPVLAWEGTSVVNTVYPYGDVRRYGAIGDGVADDTAAINAAVSACLAAGGGNVYLPPGTYKTTSNLIVSVTGSAPKGIKIFGVPLCSVITPTSAVTVALTIAGASNTNGITNRVHLEGIDLEGTNTTSATGLLVGDNAGNLSGYITARDMQIYRFKSAGGKGLYVKNVVKGDYTNVYVGRCDTNLYASGDTVQGLPTLQTFNACAFREADTKGVNIVAGYQVVFNDCVSESNTQEGLYVAPTLAADNAVDIQWNRGWIEGNYNTAGHYQVLADGSLGAGTVSVKFRGTKFNGGIKDIYFKNVVNFLLDDIDPVNRAGDVLIDTGCIGTIANWPQNNAPIATVLVCNALGAVGMLESKAQQRLAWDANGDLSPTSNFPFNLGTATFRYGNVFCKTAVPWMSQPTYGTTVTPDSSAGRTAQIVVTDGVGYTIAKPTNGSWGQELKIQVLNSSGGAMGAVNFGGGIKQTGFAAPANGKYKTADFVYDLTNWIQTTPWTADV